jgi:hypothetical protein
LIVSHISRQRDAGFTPINPEKGDRKGDRTLRSKVSKKPTSGLLASGLLASGLLGLLIVCQAKQANCSPRHDAANVYPM